MCHPFLLPYIADVCIGSLGPIPTLASVSKHFTEESHCLCGFELETLPPLQGEVAPRLAQGVSGKQRNRGCLRSEFGVLKGVGIVAKLHQDHGFKYSSCQLLENT